VKGLHAILGGFVGAVFGLLLTHFSEVVPIRAERDSLSAQVATLKAELAARPEGTQDSVTCYIYNVPVDSLVWQEITSKTYIRFTFTGWDRTASANDAYIVTDSLKLIGVNK